MSIIPDSHRELAEAAGIAVLSTFGPDGFPQSTAVGYLLDGDLFRANGQLRQAETEKPATAAGMHAIHPGPRQPSPHARSPRPSRSLIADDDFTWAAKVAESRGGTVDDVRRITPPGQHRFCITVHPVKTTTYG